MKEESRFGPIEFAGKSPEEMVAKAKEIIGVLIDYIDNIIDPDFLPARHSEAVRQAKLFLNPLPGTKEKP